MLTGGDPLEAMAEFEAWCEMHWQQLQQVPERYWETLHMKLCSEVVNDDLGMLLCDQFAVELIPKCAIGVYFSLPDNSQLFDAGDVFIMTPRSDGWRVFVRTREVLSASSPKSYVQERESVLYSSCVACPTYCYLLAGLTVITHFAWHSLEDGHAALSVYNRESVMKPK